MKVRVSTGKCKVMRGVWVQDDGRVNVRLDGELLEEVESFRYLRSTVVVKEERMRSYVTEWKKQVSVCVE